MTDWTGDSTQESVSTLKQEFFNFTVGQPHPVTGLSFYFSMVLMDRENLTEIFPKDFDRIGKVEFIQQHYIFSPVTLRPEVVEIPLKFESCTRGYFVEAFGEQHADGNTPVGLEHKLLCLAKGQ